MFDVHQIEEKNVDVWTEGGRGRTHLIDACKSQGKQATDESFTLDPAVGVVVAAAAL